jgi:dihydrofolate reductase
VVDSLDAALALVKDCEEVMIIGGAQIYQQALPLADRLYLTWVHHHFEGDTFFPTWLPEQWHEISREQRAADEQNPYDLTFTILERTEKR